MLHPIKNIVPLCSLAFLLVACGGGGGGSDNTGSSSTTAGAGQSSSTASQSSSSSSASSTNVLRTPSLQTPDSGSTALVGNATEGIWRDDHGLLALISPEGKTYQRGNYLNLVGSLILNAGTWQLSPDTLSGSWAASGSGTYTAKSTLSGLVTLTTGVPSGNSYALTLSYDNNNARAVTQESVAGSWPTADAVIDSEGNLSAHDTTWGNCTYSGTVKLHAPDTHKNLFDFTMDVTNVDGTCKLSGKHYSGLAALLVFSDGTEQLHFLTERPDHSTGMEGYWDR